MIRTFHEKHKKDKIKIINVIIILFQKQTKLFTIAHEEFSYFDNGLQLSHFELQEVYVYQYK